MVKMSIIDKANDVSIVDAFKSAASCIYHCVSLHFTVSSLTNILLVTDSFAIYGNNRYPTSSNM